MKPFRGPATQKVARTQQIRGPLVWKSAVVYNTVLEADHGEGTGGLAEAGPEAGHDSKDVQSAARKSAGDGQVPEVDEQSVLGVDRTVE